MDIELKNFLIAIQSDIRELKQVFNSLPQWIAISDVSKKVGLTPQAVRKQLLKGDFEPEVDFKYFGSRIYIARNAISRIKRIRK